MSGCEFSQCAAGSSPRRDAVARGRRRAVGVVLCGEWLSRRRDFASSRLRGAASPRCASGAPSCSRGERDLEAAVEVERRVRARRARRRRPSRAAAPAACARRRRASPLAADRDEQHRHRRAERVGQREQDRLEPTVVLRREHGDRREHRAGARHEDEAEARAEQEAAAEVAPRRRVSRANGRSSSSPSGEDQRRRKARRAARSPGSAGRPRGSPSRLSSHAVTSVKTVKLEDDPGDDRVAACRPSLRRRAGSAEREGRRERAR